MDERAQQLLKIINEQNKKSSEGKLKIFLGMVAGVGKTFAMLREAHELHRHGKNVAIGFIVTHGRKETEHLVAGIPILARKTLTYKGKLFEEMDLAAIIEYKPQVVLIDELAHTNIPGVKHAKRFQDVLEVLQQGIDVYTTLNVQHIESCAGTVKDITNISIQETLPDSIIDRADEIILIDLAPEKVLARLHEGKIYPQEKVQSSLENFFNKNNLTALREMVLRLLADKVNHDLRDSKTVMGVPQIWKIGHRLLVPISVTSDGEKIIRATKRLASSLNASWLAGFVETGKKLHPAQENIMKRNLNLAKQLGAEVIIVNDHDTSHGLIRMARNHQVTQIVLSKKFPSRFNKFINFIRFRQKSFLERILMNSLETNVLFLGDYTQEKEAKLGSRFFIDSREWKGLPISLGGIFCIGYLSFISFPMQEYQTVGIIYLILLNITSLFSGRLTIILSCFLCALSWNFFFIPPRYTFRVTSVIDWFILVSFLIATMVTGLLTSKLRKKEVSLLANDERLSILYFLTRNIAETRGVEKIVRLILDKILDMFPVQAGVFLAKEGESKKLDQNVIGNLQLTEKEFSVATWSFLNHKTAGKSTEVLSSVQGLYLPLMGGVSCYGVLGIVTHEKEVLSSGQMLILEDIAKHFALGLEREILNENLQKSQINDAIEKVYKTLLNSVSHELKTPLAAIKGSASALLDEEILINPISVKELSEQILLGSNRMQLLIQNLLDMGRIEAGKMSLKLELNDARDIFNSVLNEMEYYFAKREFKVAYHSPDIPLIFIDFTLFEQAVKNIVQNACLYSPPHLPIEITISCQSHKETTISIRDHGPGLPVDDPSVVFQKFYRVNSSVPGGSGLGLTISKAIVEMHGGEIIAQNAATGGAQFIIKIPSYKGGLL